MVQALVADSVIDIEASRGLIRHCAEALDAGGRGTHESSVAKVFVAEAVGPRRRPRDADLRRRSASSDDLPLARYLARCAPFRIYDGPTETHRWAIARRAARRRQRER